MREGVCSRHGAQNPNAGANPRQSIGGLCSCGRLSSVLHGCLLSPLTCALHAADDVVARYLLGDDILLAPYNNGGGNYSTRDDVWIPPGDWIDAWTGAVVKGNVSHPQALIKVNQSLERMPMWHRSGGLVVTAATVAMNVASQDWSKLVLEAFPCRACAARATTGAVQDGGGDGGGFRTTRVVKRKQRLDGEPSLPHHVTEAVITMHNVGSNGVRIFLNESAAPPSATAEAGAGSACVASPREWVVRLHLLHGEMVRGVEVDGATVPVPTLPVTTTDAGYDGGSRSRAVDGHDGGGGGGGDAVHTGSHHRIRSRVARAVLLHPRGSLGSNDSSSSGATRVPPTTPFSGAGERPGPFAGPTLEVWIAAAERRKCGVEVKLIYR